jgi:uncharacterized protein YgbK (DUF1537 family)
MATDDLLLTFYGDDFTGSTDVLESLALNGVETVLFFEPPQPDDLDQFGGVQAVGVAGQSRTMSAAEMDEHLPPIFEALDRFDASLFQYKVCSTFDSSPTVGSIGHAIDLGRETFDASFVPVVVAAPSLKPRGRYVVFGNLFATVDGETYRLDRHPTMSEHPITPMTEADITRHLGEQTDRDIGLCDIRSIDGRGIGTLESDLDRILTRNEIVVFDGLSHDHQQIVGRLIWERSTEKDGQVFSASSSGLNYALTSHWRDVGVIDELGESRSIGEVDQIVVMSGSASPVNKQQIEWALNHGFDGIRLDTAALINPDESDYAREQAVDTALDALKAGRSVVCYTARGPNDPAIDETLERAESLGLADSEVGERIGTAQGRITRRLLRDTGLRRACVSGGDTSGYVVPHLDVYALEFAARVGPGSPLCIGRADQSSFDGVELALKGGQVETTNADADYFGVVRDGGLGE